MGIFGSLNVRPQSSLSNIQHSAAATFINCKFDENSNLHKSYGDWKWHNYDVQMSTKGTLFSEYISTNLMGRIIFCSNYGSAINAEASDITISSGSTIQRRLAK